MAAQILIMTPGAAEFSKWLGSSDFYKNMWTIDEHADINHVAEVKCVVIVNKWVINLTMSKSYNWRVRYFTPPYKKAK